MDKPKVNNEPSSREAQHRIILHSIEEYILSLDQEIKFLSIKREEKIEAKKYYEKKMSLIADLGAQEND